MTYMNTMTRWTIAAALVCCLTSVAPRVVHAQQKVELIGLKRWTVQMVKDSLVKYVPGADTTLTSRSCGAQIRELGFPRTASIVYPTRDLVAVVEPQDSAAAPANAPIHATHALPAAWQAALDPLAASNGQFKNGVFNVSLKLYPEIRKGLRDSIGKEMQRRGGDVPPQLDTLWAFLQAHATDADLQHAIAILNDDSAYTHRAFAIAVLSNFPSRDEAWWALIHALRDPNPAMNNASLYASQVLTGWLDTPARRVEWKGAAQVADLKALFGGANLWVLPAVLTTVAHTQIDPSLAHAVLANNAVYLLGWANSADPTAAAIGHDALKQFAGRDLGTDHAVWQRWVSAL